MIPMPELSASGMLYFAGLTIGIGAAAALFKAPADTLQSAISKRSN
tara:strand:+ start:2149 stop:2286 length:138 start_codon:yes stop_codon:yes gene_type:complete